VAAREAVAVDVTIIVRWLDGGGGDHAIAVDIRTDLNTEDQTGRIRRIRRGTRRVAPGWVSRVSAPAAFLVIGTVAAAAELTIGGGRSAGSPAAVAAVVLVAVIGLAARGRENPS
jgi:hypothetical protein